MRGGKIILVVIVAIAIVIGVVWRQKSAPKKAEESASTQQIAAPVDQAQLAAAYQANLRALLPDYKSLLQNPANDALTQMRQRLLDLKLPAEFRDLHASLVLLLDKAEINNKSGTTNYVKQLEGITKDYQWLKE